MKKCVYIKYWARLLLITDIIFNIYEIFCINSFWLLSMIILCLISNCYAFLKFLSNEWEWKNYKNN